MTILGTRPPDFGQSQSVRQSGLAGDAPDIMRGPIGMTRPSPTMPTPSINTGAKGPSFMNRIRTGMGSMMRNDNPGSDIYNNIRAMGERPQMPPQNIPESGSMFQRAIMRAMPQPQYMSRPYSSPGEMPPMSRLPLNVDRNMDMDRGPRPQFYNPSPTPDRSMAQDFGPRPSPFTQYFMR